MKVTYGQTVIESPETKAAYALAVMLECYPASPEATACSSAAWELLDKIGKYERGLAK